MSNPLIPPMPLPDDDRTDAAEGAEPTESATVEQDGDRTIDPDADPDLMDSAEADRLASGADTDGDVR